MLSQQTYSQPTEQTVQALQALVDRYAEQLRLLRAKCRLLARQVEEFKAASRRTTIKKFIDTLPYDRQA